MRLGSSSGRQEGGPAGALEGGILIAMPGMADPRFQRSVIYLCTHDDNGAMGLVVNQPRGAMTFRNLAVQLDLMEPEDAIRLPERISHAPILRGGPVEPSRGFVLHSDDFLVDDSTRRMSQGICLTATLDILKAIMKDQGPTDSIVALGYAGWSGGQLERELQENAWLHAPCDPKLLFSGGFESKYDRALRLLGIDPAMLSGEVGHA
jgi:putative transcriptional regulator